MATRAVPGVADVVRRQRDPLRVEIYSLAVVSLFLLTVVPSIFGNHAAQANVEALAAFGIVAVCADMMRIRSWHAMSFAVSLPVTLAAGMVLPPWQAGLVAFAACLDLAEIRREIPLPRALFNRAEVGLAVMGSSAVFHAVGGSVLDWPGVLLVSLLTLATDCALNVLLVSYPIAALNDAAVPSVMRHMFSPNPLRSVAMYVGLGLMAPLIALTWSIAGIFGLAAFLLPIAIAHLALAQAPRLEESARRVEEKSRALAELLERTSEERRDERLTISGELHDEVLPSLFKVHLMGQVLRQDLSSGKLLQLDDDIPELLAATDTAQSAVRELVSDLRRSPLGRNGLISTLRLLARNLEVASRLRIDLDLEEFDVSHVAQLVAYQVAREAMTNAARYSRGKVISVRLLWDEGLLRLIVEDDGMGFDPGRVDRNRHFGLQLMSERVEAVGGRLVVDSELGGGTRVVVSLPPAL